MTAPLTVRRRITGFTLVELMVTAGILALLSIAFGAVVAKSAALVTAANAAHRAHTVGLAFSSQLRRDLLTTARCGFLHVGENGDTLVLTRAGKHEHPGADRPAPTAACVCYSLRNNVPTGGETVLLRTTAILSDGGEADDDPATGDIIEGVDLGNLARDDGPVADIIDTLLRFAREETRIHLPPQNLIQVRHARYILADCCRDVRFAAIGAAGADGTWTAAAPPETWPAAIRATLSLSGTNAKNTKEFETICTVGH